MTDENEIREAKRMVRRGAWYVGKWWLVGIVAVLIVGAGLWGLNVATSGARGQGDAIVEKNSAENWTAAQAKFEDLYAGIIAADQKIQVAADTLAANPGDKTYTQTYTGLVSGCLDLVGDYNAEARKFLAEEFRAADLPPEIDTNASATDCKED